MSFFKKYTEEDLVNIKEHKFEPFHKTYKWLTFTLILGNLFPDPATDRFRIVCILVLQVAAFPLYAMIVIEMYKLWTEGDIYNIIQHSTISGPLLGVYMKMYLMYYKRVQTKEMLDEIDQDHESFNSLPREQQDAAFLGIKTGIRNVERIWSPIVTVAIMMFACMAIVMSIYSCTFDNEPRKYTPITGDPKGMSTFPYFELLFMYETAFGFISVLNFTAYDGLFGVAANHACLKMKLCCLKLNDAFQCEEEEGMYEGIVEFIEEQKRMFKFVDLIRDVFTFWLGVILISAMLQIGSLLFLVSAGIDLRYALISFMSILHIFLLCMYSGTMTSTSTEMATMIYCSGWENARTPRVRRMLPFLLARAQVPNYITAFNLFVFDMELFVNILRTSYSMYTLIRE